MRNVILIFFTISIFNPLIGGAAEINFHQLLSRYVDEVGNGILTEGSIKNRTKIDLKVLEKDYCAGRMAIGDEAQLNFEFDYLGSMNLVPYYFTLDNAQIDQINPKITIMQSQRQLVDSFQICKEGDQAIETTSQLLLMSNSIAITWIQRCKNSKGIEEKFRELLCELK
jgi:hypothetical protein